ncbi:hypothetical protein EDD11_007953 [Mortierella claussenii]|nr:hypothetical protein EDD11_007953 [Mortierella claussenii]
MDKEILLKISQWERAHVKGNKKPIVAREYPPMRVRQDIVLQDIKPRPLPQKGPASAVPVSGPRKPVVSRGTPVSKQPAESRQASQPKLQQDADLQNENKKKGAASMPPVSGGDRSLSKPEGANAEKEKGNGYFKKGQYDEAIECYSRAMALDPSNGVLPVNRAMALLKLNRFADAEQDCTLGLKLDSKNVKALWRRGIARRSLGKQSEARHDFEAALKVDPLNKAVKDELQKLDKDESQQLSQAKPLAQPSSTPLVISSKRVPIKEVENDQTSTLFASDKQVVPKPSVILTDSTIQAASPTPTNPTKPLSSSPSLIPSPTPLSNPPISEHSGKVRVASTTPSSDPSSTLSQPLTAGDMGLKSVTKRPELSELGFEMILPKTSMEFQRDWKSYSKVNDYLYLYLKLIPPEKLPWLFKSSFESHHLSSILAILNAYYLLFETPQIIYSILVELAKVERFNMAVMFMPKDPDLLNLVHVMTYLKDLHARGQQICTAMEFSALSKKYGAPILLDS